MYFIHYNKKDKTITSREQTGEFRSVVMGAGIRDVEQTQYSNHNLGEYRMWCANMSLDSVLYYCKQNKVVVTYDNLESSLDSNAMPCLPIEPNIMSKKLGIKNFSQLKFTQLIRNPIKIDLWSNHYTHTFATMIQKCKIAMRRYSKKLSNKQSNPIIMLYLFSYMFYANMQANGFKIQEQSLNATALSSAYVAGARGADASYYNPANMGFKNDWGENKHEFEFAFSLINIPGFDFQVPTTNQGLSSVTYMKYKGIVGQIGSILGNIIPKRVELQHTKPDTAMVNGSTGDTNFMLPKFFYKSKTYNGFTFGASFIAPSGLAMKWNGLGGEFLQDVFIFLIEFAPSISYTYRDRISIGFAPRILYGMGKFNNIVYVPLGTAQDQNQNPTDGSLPETRPNAGKNCTPSFDPNILESLPDGLIPPDMAGMFEAIIENPSSYPVLGLPPNSSQLDAIKAMVAKIQTCLVGTAQVVQKSDGSDIGFGYRASVSARVGEGGMFSVVYNSAVPMKFEGKVSADTVIGGPVGSVRMDAPLYLYVTMPEILTIAYSHDWTLKNKHKLRLEATYERTFWSRGRKFETKFGWDSAVFTASPGSVPESFTQEQLKGMVGLADFSAVAMGNGWVDTNTFRVGATYITKYLRLMLSAAYDKAPVPQTAIGIPDSDGYMVGLGAKYNFRDFDVGVSLSNTFKNSSSSVYASGGVGQLRIATFSLGYRW
ncbi:Outer membrane protein P1 OmpP1 [Helicobacter trogontum]|uniref:Outer membrane protein P1 OmpP1 n=1 Tax=Helicobacter trogontum TaxID=50960 RepID=A0ABQ0D0X7_9HELI